MNLNAMIDHTMLKADASKNTIIRYCEEAKQYGFASVCVNTAFVPLVAEQLKGSQVKTCCVVGFPLGAMLTSAKAFEAAEAVKAGAQEVDMVINTGKVKEGDFAYTEEEVRRVKEAIGDTTLKVILETSILTDEEIKEACLASVRGGAQFVKTSTGFNKAGGASVHAVRIMRETVGENVGVKASGGIHHLSEVEEMVEAGANRIGCSASVNIMKEKELF